MVLTNKTNPTPWESHATINWSSATHGVHRHAIPSQHWIARSVRLNPLQVKNSGTTSIPQSPHPSTSAGQMPERTGWQTESFVGGDYSAILKGGPNQAAKLVRGALRVRPALSGTGNGSIYSSFDPQNVTITWLLTSLFSRPRFLRDPFSPCFVGWLGPCLSPQQNTERSIQCNRLATIPHKTMYRL